jgi:hypothetical protein
MSTLTRDAMLQRNIDDKERLKHRMEKKIRDARRLRIEEAAHAAAAAEALLYPPHAAVLPKVEPVPTPPTPAPENHPPQTKP